MFCLQHLLCVLGLVQTQLGIITMLFNIYLALAIITPHKQACLLPPFLSLFFQNSEFRNANIQTFGSLASMATAFNKLNLAS